MKVNPYTWKSTKTDKFRLSVNENIPAGSTMEFAGASSSSYVNDIWAPGTVKLWVSSYGNWVRQITYPESDQVLMDYCKDHYKTLFPDVAFSALDDILNNVDNIVYDDENNYVRWPWKSSISVYPALNNVLNNHVMKYPFKQTTTTESNIACLVVNVEPEEIDQWGSSIVSTNIEDFTVPKNSDNCWFVSLFEDMQTSDGITIERGKFYKMSKDINLLKTDNHNRVVSLWMVE